MTREDAIKKVSSWNLPKETREILEALAPELCESEDERIRKGLIEALKTTKTVGELKFILPEPTREEAVAYLEKQKENPQSADSIPSDCVSNAKCEDKSPKRSDSGGTDIIDTPAYWKGWDDAMKQKEQKHPNGCFTCDEYKKGYESGRLNGFTAGYNKAMKEVDQKEQKPKRERKKPKESWLSKAKYELAHKEELESKRQKELSEIRALKNTEQKPADLSKMMVYKEPYIAPVPTPMVADEQKPAEWSKEDELMIKCCQKAIQFFRENAQRNEKGIRLPAQFSAGGYLVTPDKVESWLKSLRPSWKPSEEQIKAIESCFCEFGEGCPDEDGLRSLYNDLKKLM